MFITLPCYPPSDNGMPDTSRSVTITVAVDAIAMMAAANAPSVLEGLTKPATLISLKTGMQIITFMSLDDVKHEISQNSLAALSKFH